MKSLKSKAFNALRSSESFFKLDMVYLAKGGFWTTLRFLIGLLASIVTMVAFGNLLPRETYGTYNYLLSLGASLSFFTLSGIGIAVTRAVARGHENIVPSALKLQIKYNLIAVLTVLSTSVYYAYKGNMLFSLSLAFLALAYPVSEAFHLYVHILTGKKRFDTITKITSITTVISAITTVTTLLLTHNILIMVAVYTTISLVPNIIAYHITTKNLDKTPPEQGQINEMRRTAFHITGAGIIGVIASYIDKIILFQVAGPSTLAVYGFALAGPERLKSLIKNWTAIALPRLAQSTLGEIRLVVYKRIGFSLIIGFALAFLYIIFAPLLFKIFLPYYLDSIRYSQILAINLIVVPATIFIGSVFASQNMLRATYLLSVGSQVLRIILFITLGWIWQIWGLIAASILSSFANGIYSIIIWEIEMRRLVKKHE